MKIGSFEFNLRELAGSMGDFGTLFPLAIGYIAVCGLDPAGFLVMMGVANIATGLIYKLPMPIEPMKVLAVVAIAQHWTPSLIYASGFAMGIVWLFFATTGIIDRLAKITPNSVVRFFGGMPMCHGCGGLAGQYYFGARTGGTNLIEGTIEIALGLFFAAAIAGLFSVFPTAIIGAMMLLVGIELTKFTRDIRWGWDLVPLTATVAAALLTNMAVGFGVGLAFHYGLVRWRGKNEISS